MLLCLSSSSMNSYFRPFAHENSLPMVFESEEEIAGSCVINSNARKKNLSGGSHIKNFEEDYDSSEEI